VLGDANMLQKFPSRVRRTGRLHSTKIGWEIVDGGVKIEMRLMAPNGVDKLPPELNRLIGFHHSYDTPQRAWRALTFRGEPLSPATDANVHAT
jgi:hypothetical protein